MLLLLMALLLLVEILVGVGLKEEGVVAKEESPPICQSPRAVLARSTPGSVRLAPASWVELARTPA